MATFQQQAIRVDQGTPRESMESLVIEEPLQININGRAFSITMRTPGDDAYLVKGLLFTEGVVQLEGLRSDLATEQREGYTQVDVRIPEVFVCEDLLEKRSLVANASCGVCGKREISDIGLIQPPLKPPRPLDPVRIEAMGSEMRSRQAGFNATGGCHAAAVFTDTGAFLAQFEDVGRHNAVDKVIGFLVAGGRIGSASILFVSGRVSFEIISKAYAAGIPFLCAVSAPSSLAVQAAERFGMSLLAFCREDRFTVYSNPQNLSRLSPAHEKA